MILEMSENIIELVDISKTYDSTQFLKINLHKKNEFLTLLGQGCGKLQP